MIWLCCYLPKVYFCLLGLGIQLAHLRLRASQAAYLGKSHTCCNVCPPRYVGTDSFTFFFFFFSLTLFFFPLRKWQGFCNILDGDLDLLGCIRACRAAFLDSPIFLGRRTQGVMQ